MPSFSEEITDLALEMAWSLWAELGASGWVRRHSWWAIDLEPLILFTAGFVDTDARLRDEALEWCVSNARLTSGARLRNLLLGAGEPAAAAYGRFAATVKAHAHVAWPGQGELLTFHRRGRSGEIDLSRPALVQLRLRAAFGVSARAEVLRLLLADPTQTPSASELVPRAAYGKGNVAAALDVLAMSGVLEPSRVGNQLRYRLARRGELAALVGGIPAAFPDWDPLLRVTTALVQFARSEPAPGVVRAAAIRGLLRTVEPDLSRLGLLERAPRSIGEVALGEDFDQWAIDLMREWAAMTALPADGATTDATYTVHRLATGDWLGTRTEAGERPRALELPEWARANDEHPRADTVIADDSDGAPVLAHVMIADALRRFGVDLAPFWGPDAENRQLAREFAEERLWHMRRGHAATFSADFLRRWVDDRRRRWAAS